MPGMMEIYEKHSDNYDELVNHEDHKGNLKRFLLNEVEFKKKTVMELGAGTGRVTRMYADLAEKVYLFDGSDHMLNQARKNLSEIKTPLTFKRMDNLDLTQIDQKADILIEGWSFGHTVSNRGEPFETTVDLLANEGKKLLESSGTYIIIETLGTNTSEPKALNENLSILYNRLEQKHGFQRHVIETDYKFDSNAEARRIAGFFFGEDFEKSLTFEKKGIIKEYTGVWIYKQ